ncbi:MAG: class I SAM-dependent methyltransferase [Acidimicrobiia bacterium]|nr:class I SAM-dependent methyltransferase [Acidimicrobiia bacterium]
MDHVEVQDELPDNLKQRIGNRFRDRRFSFFEAFLKQLDEPISVLDVGGTQQYWVQRGVLSRLNISVTLVNLKHVPVSHERVTSVVADATDLRQYADGQFDVVFSNSVIEHVGSRQMQRLLATEIQRVGRYHYVQTPSRYFPIEPHFLLPYFQFYPRVLAHWILTKTPLSRGRRWGEREASAYIEEIDLLSKRFLATCFPDSHIMKESVLGVAKSYTAHNLG